MATWVEAVKAYAKETGKWSVPKKGTPEYDAIKALQQKLNAPVKAPEPEVKKRGRPKKPEVAPVAEVKEEAAPIAVKEKKEKKVKAAEAPVAPVAPVTPISKEVKKEKKAVKVAEPAMEVIPEKKKAVRADKKKAVGIRIENQQVVLSFD